MMWLVFPKLQKVVGEFYFRLLGEVNRNQRNIAERKRRISVGLPVRFKRRMSGENGCKIAAQIFKKPPIIPYRLKIECAVTSSSRVDLALTGVDYWSKVLLFAPPSFGAVCVPNIESILPVLDFAGSRTTRAPENSLAIMAEGNINIGRVIGKS